MQYLMPDARRIAQALVLAFTLSGCAVAKGPGSVLHTWRNGTPGERALIVIVGACLVTVGVILATDRDGDGGGGGGNDSGGVCIGVCTPPPPPGPCFLGEDVTTGAPCSK